MEIPEIPADIGITSVQWSDAELSSAPSSAHSRSSHHRSQNETPNDLNSIEEWDGLIRKAEGKWEIFDGPDDQKNALAASALNIYRQLLSRFPFLTEYWKRFSVFTYKARGLKESLSVLELASKEYSQSVSLWTEYLTALTSAGVETHDADHIDKEFARGKAHVGFNFNSDPFWDMYISHSSKKDDPKELLDVYLSLVKIPLYQYARYFNQFTELNKNFDVKEVVAEERLGDYLLQYKKESTSDLSALEKQQIIDDYSNGIFVETQREVNDMWAFESGLGFQEFDLGGTATPSPWLNYLKHELSLLNDLEDGSQKALKTSIVASLFERALVPNCYDSELWLLYSQFAESRLSFEEVKAIYDKAVFRFVPLDEPDVREHYTAFLLKNDKHDLCNEYLFDLIKAYSGSNGAHTYRKSPYAHSLRQLMRFWKEKASSEKLRSALETLITGFFDRVDRYKKEPSAKPGDDVEEPSFEIRPVHTTLLAKLLNNDGISIVVVSYLRLLQDAGEVLKIRTFYNKYGQEQVFSWSVQFWKFFVEFEGYDQVNLVNLRSILNYIKEGSALPQRAVEAFSEIYHEIVMKNLKTAMLLKGQNGEDLHDSLIYRYRDKSHSLRENHSAFKRMANNNAKMKDLREQERSKNDPNHYSPSQFNETKEFREFVKSHSFNPGIFQYIPKGLNPDNYKWISLLDEDAEIPDPPEYDDLEKAFAPIQYPDE